MALAVKIFTLNCGNDKPGEVTSSALVANFLSSEAELFILNCQEVDFAKAFQELHNAAVKQGLVVSSDPALKMVTHTKLSTQLHDHTGMKTFFLHRPTLTLNFVREESAYHRRESTRLSAGFNKGGILTRIRVEKNSGETYTIDSLSAHLDAFSAALRAQDWANVYYLQTHKVTSWDDLVSSVPDLLCAGYDANTRNKLIEQDGLLHSENGWQDPSAVDMRGLFMAPLGNHRLSQPSTYHSDEPEVLMRPDRKRPGYARGGMLDIVSYNDREAALQLLRGERRENWVEANALAFDPEEGALRDHAVIGNQNLVLVENKPAFTKVCEALACSLLAAAPELARLLVDQTFVDTPEHQAYLLVLYQAYLGPEGLLGQTLSLEVDKLRYLEEAAPEHRQELQLQLFAKQGPWFALGEETLPESDTELEQLVSYQRSILQMERFKVEFLKLALCSQERAAVCQIVDNAVKHLSSSLNTEDQTAYLNQLRQLLSCNQLLQSYARYLQETKAKEEIEPNNSQELLLQKQAIIETLEDILLSETQPGEVVDRLSTELRQSRNTLDVHRHDDRLSTLFRALLSLLGSTMLSRGAFFADKASRVLNQAENQSEAELSEQQRR